MRNFGEANLRRSLHAAQMNCFQPVAPTIIASPLQCAVVHTKGFTCLGFRDAEGQWRNAYHPDDPPLQALRIEVFSSQE